MLRQYCFVMQPFAFISHQVYSTSYVLVPLVVGSLVLMERHHTIGIQRFLDDEATKLCLPWQMAVVGVCQQMTKKAHICVDRVSSNLMMNIECRLHPYVKFELRRQLRGGVCWVGSAQSLFAKWATINFF